MALACAVPAADFPAADARRAADTLAPIAPRDRAVPVEDLHVVIYAL